MIRFIVRTCILLFANAIGLLVAAAVLDGVDVGAMGFTIAVVLFTVTVAIVSRLLKGELRGRNRLMLGGASLLATLVGLIFTALVSGGLSIHGVGTWIAATVIVWAASLLGVFLIPFLGLRKYVEAH